MTKRLERKCFPLSCSIFNQYRWWWNRYSG